ncbi:sarcosine oxidase subunit gamma [Pseudonocardia charpentierae]|uniref:Sarcosine oxidase subunit gamma family protein n=1 Tax=Pseudonocardia charpentierae TaxID=3075545 RepID=A0ABU2NGS6_9PSEU|nr:sarcosine oxidase subunit gamma family protein [Pseudonocardia sp. DSM 45834]MDT0352678.1 sarcosine oxidase subunit gamma family protein [Pseudonocardia sp. DSM 45834]
MTAESYLAPLTRTAPLVGWGDALGALPDGVQITPRPFVAMADLRVDPTGPAAAAVAAYLDVALPTAPSTYVESETATAIWLGPDEWLITSPFRTPEELETGLRAAVSGEGSVVDVSAQRTTLRLRGEHVRDLLSGGCAIDLHPRVFLRGAAAQTLLGQAGVVLMALDDTGTHYQIVVRSSFAGYVTSWLLDAATEYRTAR